MSELEELLKKVVDPNRDIDIPALSDKITHLVKRSLGVDEETEGWVRQLRERETAREMQRVAEARVIEQDAPTDMEYWCPRCNMKFKDWEACTDHIWNCIEYG